MSSAITVKDLDGDGQLDKEVGNADSENQVLALMGSSKDDIDTTYTM